MRQAIEQSREYRIPYHWYLTNNCNYRYEKMSEIIAHEINKTCHGGRGLDIGCGDGRSAYEVQALLGRGFELEGVDIDARAVHFANFYGHPIKFHAYDGLVLPYADASLDYVYAREVIEHVPDASVSHFTEEMWRVLKKGGVAVVSVPSRRIPLSSKHMRHYSRESLAALFSHEKWEMIESFTFGRYPRGLLLWIYKAMNLAPGLWKVFRSRWERASAESGMTVVAVFIKKA